MKEKIYLKAFDNIGFSTKGFVNIDLNTIKKNIFECIDWNSEMVYLFTIVFFLENNIPKPIIRRIEFPFLNDKFNDDEEDLLYEILDAVNHLSINPVYAITRQNFSQDGKIWCDDGNSEIYAIRDCNGDIMKEFLIKF